LWLVANVAEAFHVLPTEVARDLAEDPEQLSLLCLSFLRYAEAKHAEQRAKSDDDLAAWQGSRVMDFVLENRVALHKERIAAREEAERAERVEQGEV
jgi:hypothetical protein